jgi:hypothetical protein
MFTRTGLSVFVLYRQCLCCTDRKPYRPTQEEIKRTSTKQTTKGGLSNVWTCRPSIFLKYAWVTYCITKGTIACYFCKRAMHQDLITFSHNGEKAFLLGEFSNWMKCQEKLKKHSQSKFHAEAHWESFIIWWFEKWYRSEISRWIKKNHLARQAQSLRVTYTSC